MTEWTSPHILRQNAVSANLFLHALLGVFCWEWVVALDFDLAMFSGKRGFRWPMILYILNRYGMLAGLIFATVLFDSPKKQNCEIGFRIVGFFVTVSVSMSSFMLSLRTMAVWNLDRCIIIPVAVLALVQFALSIFAGIGLRTTWDGQLGCVATSFVSPGPAVLYGYTVAFDLIILILTGWKLWSLAMYQAAMQHRTKGVAVLLFKDGLMYFVVACAVNMVSLVCSILNLNPVVTLAANAQANILTTIASCRVVRRLVIHNEDANNYFSNLIPTISIDEPSGIRRSVTATGAVQIELTPSS